MCAAVGVGGNVDWRGAHCRFCRFFIVCWGVLLSMSEFKGVCRACRPRVRGKSGKDRGKSGKGGNHHIAIFALTGAGWHGRGRAMRVNAHVFRHARTAMRREHKFSLPVYHRGRGGARAGGRWSALAGAVYSQYIVWSGCGPASLKVVARPLWRAMVRHDARRAARRWRDRGMGPRAAFRVDPAARAGAGSPLLTAAPVWRARGRTATS